MPEADGIFYNFKELFDRLSTQLDQMASNIASSFAEMNAKLDTKASKDSLEALERRMHAEFEVVGNRVKAAEDAIIEIRVNDAGPRAISKFQMVVFAIITASIFGLITALFVAVLHGGSHA